MAILKAKQGDDNWANAGGAGEETKDSLRKKVHIYLSSLQRSSKTQYLTMLGNFGSPFAL